LEEDTLEVKENGRMGIGKEMRGIATTLDGNEYALRCKVLETAANGTLMADCGGSPGASGTALVSRKGKLIAIHLGAGN
jgi:hypothetical protein